MRPILSLGSSQFSVLSSWYCQDSRCPIQNCSEFDRPGMLMDLLAAKADVNSAYADVSPVVCCAVVRAVLRCSQSVGVSESLDCGLHWLEPQRLVPSTSSFSDTWFVPIRPEMLELSKCFWRPKLMSTLQMM